MSDTPATLTGDNEITKLDGAQAPSANANTEATSTESSASQEAWKNDPRYFQTGEKAGQLRPQFRNTSEDARRAEAAIFDPTGVVSPQGKTDGATLPEFSRPAAKGAKAASKKKQAEAPDYLTAAVLYNSILVGGCKLLSDEYEQSKELQKQTLEAAIEYFKTSDIQLPPWVGLAAVTLVNIGAAVKTPKGASRIRSALSSAKVWYVKWRG